MDQESLESDWQALAAYLPPDLKPSAREHRFLRRSTGRLEAATWLRLILRQVVGGWSLAQTVARAKGLGWATVSAGGLAQAAAQAGPGLTARTSHLLGNQRQALGGLPPLQDRGVRIVAATDMQAPGATGTDWRLHYSRRLPTLVCDHFEITAATGAERRARFAFRPRELVLADRGYGHRHGVAQVVAAPADVVVRLVPANFPLLDACGHPFDVLRHGHNLTAGRPREWRVWFDHAGHRYPLRRCVLRKPAAATQEARRKRRQKARRHGTELQPQTLQATAFVRILPSLPAPQWSTAQVLAL